jgi:heavy metal sensor kinase
MRRMSIGLRLTLWYLAIFAAAQLAFGAGMWLILRQNFYRIADQELQSQVEDLIRFFQAQKKNATVSKLQEEAAEAYVIEHSGDYLQILDSENNWIFRAGSLRRNSIVAPSPAAIQRISFDDRQLDGIPFRFLTERIEVNHHFYSVQTGVPIASMMRTLSLFRRYLLMFAPLVLLAAASGGFWLSRRALAPVDALTRNARTISGRNLRDRLATPETGDELQRLSETLNEMLARIEDAFLRVTQFTADASHELRTPIALIRTEAEIVLRRSRGEPEYREALRHILLEAERTTTLMEELLALARADSGRENLQLAPLDLQAIVGEAGQEWKQLIENRNLRFYTSVTDREIPVMADRVAVQRLLAILLDNAVKYTNAPGSIKLSLQEVGRAAMIGVRDSGIGIAEEDQSKIFDRFYRVDRARSRELGGAGIGLAIAQWIVQQHRGSITVESSLGRGSVFMVKFPLWTDSDSAQRVIDDRSGQDDRSFPARQKH